jgi:hypothetical protein
MSIAPARFGVALALACACLSASPTAQSPSSAPAFTADDLFDDNHVNDLWLRINARDWARLREAYLDDTYYPADVEWRGVVVRNIGVRSRGRASRNGQKPALRLDFNRYSQGQQFLGLDAVGLDNLWQDPSMLRERLAMHLFRRMGVPAPRETHVRLFVGPAREFAGVYGLVEAIDKRFLARHFNQDQGFLYQYKWVDEYRFEDRADLAWYAPRFDPATHENASTFDLYAPLRKMVGAVNTAPESALATTLSPYLDLRKVITYIAIENFLAEADGFLGGVGMANFYIYRFAATDSWQLIPWDRDLSFAVIDDVRPAHNFQTNVLTRKIWAVPELRRLYLQTLLAVAASADGWLKDEAVREYAQIREAARQDPLKPSTNAEFEEAVDFVTRFAQQRGAVVRAWVAEIAPEIVATLTANSTPRIPPRDRAIQSRPR